MIIKEILSPPFFSVKIVTHKISVTGSRGQVSTFDITSQEVMSNVET